MWCNNYSYEEYASPSRVLLLINSRLYSDTIQGQKEQLSSTLYLFEEKNSCEQSCVQTHARLLRFFACTCWCR